jgi:uncharacterized protein (TIGR02271 family)
VTGERSDYTGREIVAEMPTVDVFTSDQERVGEAIEIGPEWVIIDRKGIFSGNLWVPAARVSGDPQGGAMYLDVARDQLDDMGWDQEPDMDAVGQQDSDTVTMSQDTETVRQSETYDASADLGGDRDSERIRVHEEELEARKTAQETGAVHVSKDVVEEQREIDVPVTREEVHVTRREVSGDASADTTAFQDGDTIRVPVVEETVEVRKVPRVVEEIEISKSAVQGTERVSDTVRREEVRVEEEGRTGTDSDDR